MYKYAMLHSSGIQLIISPQTLGDLGKINQMDLRKSKRTMWKG